MKKLILLLTLVVMVGSFTLLNANPAKYDDIKEMTTTQIKLLESIVKGAEAAQNAADFAVVLNDFAKGMKSMLPEVEELMKKYPNIKELTQTNPPEELKEITEKMKGVSMKFMGVFQKAQQWMTDPAVQKAQGEFQKVMGEYQALSKKYIKNETPAEEKK